MGSMFSSSWFVLHFYFTHVHETDAEIINHTGLLRYYTERVGVTLLSEKFLPRGRDIDGLPKDSPIQTLGELCESLLGERSQLSEAARSGISHTEGGCAAEMLDEDVKDALRAWKRDYLSSLQDLHTRAQTLSTSEWHEVVDLVHDAAQAVNAVVTAAATKSNGRVQVLLVISIVRAITGVMWAFAVAYTFGKVWRPYVQTYNQLQVYKQEAKSFLCAAFDALVPVSTVAPFHVLSSDVKFDHMLGQPMLGKSILSCAKGPEEEQALLSVLGRAKGADATRNSWMSCAEKSAWWNILPQKPPDCLPVATMISTCWNSPHVEDGLKVEVLVVDKAYASSTTADTTLLVVRSAVDNEVIGPIIDEAEVVLVEQVEESRVEVPAIQDQDSASALQSMPNTSSGSSDGTTACLGPAIALPVSPHSELEDTPPPSMVRDMPTRPNQDEAAQEVTRDLTQVAVQLEQVAQESRPGITNDNQTSTTSSGSQTPPMIGMVKRRL